MFELSKLYINPDNPFPFKGDESEWKDFVTKVERDPEFLEARPIVYDSSQSENGKFKILAGNKRFKAYSDLGFQSLPKSRFYDCKNWSPEKKRRFELADNWHPKNSEWDVNFITDDEAEEWDIEFQADEVHLEAKEDDYVAPAEIQTDIVVGDLFELRKGELRHRVLCGDSTNVDDVELLVDGSEIGLIHTDPPYGISHSGKGIKGAVDGNDFGEILGDSDLTVAIDSYNLCTQLFPNASLIFWGANYYPSVLNNGFGWIVWDKEKEGDLFSGAELAYFNKGVKVDVFRHQWHGMIKASEQGQKRIHPTQKPIALAQWCINKTNALNVLDLFLGSHSTMVAAHQLNRNCYGMELEPKYVQVGIDRMLKLDPDITLTRNGKDVTAKYREKLEQS